MIDQTTSVILIVSAMLFIVVAPYSYWRLRMWYSIRQLKKALSKDGGIDAMERYLLQLGCKPKHVNGNQRVYQYKGGTWTFTNLDVAESK